MTFVQADFSVFASPLQKFRRSNRKENQFVKEKLKMNQCEQQTSAINLIVLRNYE